MTKPTKRKAGVRAWAIYRDGKFYRAYAKQWKNKTAKEHCHMLVQLFKSGRKHKWRTVPVTITEDKS